MHRPRAGIALLLTLLLALATVGPVTGMGAGHAPATDARADQQADPETDVIGWENGYWHDERIAVDPTDGLNETELDRVIARAMARVEAVRDVEFEAEVPVSIISRETYRERLADGPNQSMERRLHQNVKFEALFFINETTDAVSVGNEDTAARTLGFYAPGTEEIVIVSPNPDQPTVDEITLAQELFHALQDQAFDAFDRPWYPGVTREEHNAADGVIEGDGNYVDYLYQQRCETDWICIRPEDPGGTTSPPPNFGLSVLRFVPYAEGPPFVQRLHEQEGWAAVNALYDNPTRSTEQYIHPKRYGTDQPVTVSVPNRSTGGWRVLDLEGGVDHATFGEAGIFSMLWYPSYLARANVIVPFDIFGEPAPGSLNYSHPASTGWAGDRLVPYINGSVSSSVETGYIWTIAWDTEADAREFLEAYERLLEFNGGTSVAEGVWQVDDSRGFEDAFLVTQTGPNVTIVNAPTIAGLEHLRPSLVSRPLTTTTPTPTPTSTSTATPTPTTASTTVSTSDVTSTAPGTSTGDSGGPSVPGFTGALAIVAVAVAALGVSRWRSR